MELTDVGTRVLYEDEQVRVWEMVLAPGEAVHWHKHWHDYAYVYVTGDNVLETTLTPEGEPFLASFERHHSQSQVVGAEGIPIHRIRNVGDHPHRQIIIETLGPSLSQETLPAVNNGRMQLLDADSTAGAAK
ncbi:hypothetical protein FPZ12_008285 [Amycolatopsis acidicola]|uniref:Cupin domain-containing protein n=1 Tax=Amycolatopsis acidicola TaxID=2596893 RepID=A0A5N0VEE9_9PSEU|nr:hypothetical protein [Amycolatopsis acidicola]KAA9164008.1 hypothetical protein FPZ12_008285 [Amycolatopsis acidicola]